MSTIRRRLMMASTNTSPYSAETTRVLKATFPAQWDAISDYGWQHPELVPYINEDPMLVCSLGLQSQGVDLPIRWLVGDGNSIIDSGLRLTDADGIYAKLKCNPQSIYMGIRTSNSEGLMTMQRTSGNLWMFAYGDQYHDYGAADYNMHESSLINGVCTFDNRATYTFSKQTFVTMGNMTVCGFNDNGILKPVRASIVNAKIWKEDTLARNFIPFISPTRDGMLDLVNLIFYQNAGTGQFTDAFTLADGVTPWTPPNP